MPPFLHHLVSEIGSLLFWTMLLSAVDAISLGWGSRLLMERGIYELVWLLRRGALGLVVVACGACALWLLLSVLAGWLLLL